MTENELGREIVDAAIKVHRALGPGLLESVYERALARELELRGLDVEPQVPIAFEYEGEWFDVGFRADLVVGRKVIIELKSTESIAPVHKKQTQTYLKLAGMKLGFLLNFGQALMKDGIVRCVNGLDE